MSCCPLPSSNERSLANGSATRSAPRRRRACGWVATCRSATTRGSARAAEASLLAGVAVDSRGERFPPSHAVKKGRRYRYYVSAALITEAGTDRAPGWRLQAQEIEDTVIRVLADALTSPAMVLDRFGTADIPSDQTRKMLDRAARLAAALNRSPAQRAKVVRDLIEKVVIEENTIAIRVRRGPLLGGPVSSSSAENPSNRPVMAALQSGGMAGW